MAVRRERKRIQTERPARRRTPREADTTIEIDLRKERSGKRGTKKEKETETERGRGRGTEIETGRRTENGTKAKERTETETERGTGIGIEIETGRGREKKERSETKKERGQEAASKFVGYGWMGGWTKAVRTKRERKRKRPHCIPMMVVVMDPG